MDNETDLQLNMINSASSSSSTLPFSISRLLGADKSIGNNQSYEHTNSYTNTELSSQYLNSPMLTISKVTEAKSVIFSPTGGVIKVPAHRPDSNSLNGSNQIHQNPSVLTSSFPWLTVDPTVLMQRSAAAAAVLASQVAKERLTGQCTY